MGFIDKACVHTILFRFYPLEKAEPQLHSVLAAECLILK